MFRMIVGFILSIFFIVSCSTSKFGWETESESDKKGERKGVFIEDFDPLSLNDDDIVVIPVVKTTKTEAEQEQRTEDLAIEENESEAEMIQGYRIQLLATGDEIQAREKKKEAIYKFHENVYLVFEAPLYKLRVGDCKTRKQAEEIKEKAVQSGFHDAWIVPSKVYSKSDEESIQ